MPVCVTAGKTTVTSDHNADINQIHITSDQLIYDSTSQNAEFIGNVKAKQTDTVIFADKLNITHSKETNPGNTGAEATIEKITATGNVKIIFGNKVAITQQATYITQTKVLVLTGKNSTISSGTDSISGAKIILDRTDGRIKIESDPDQQVKAVLHSGSDSLND
ncbi:MAG: LptA/OstA family protein [Desulfobacterales bacterium]|nr:LptA/OstA family protein [Desulfobacterales bacterium]MDD4070768.1 LptA/OstA family protein [Desulfobacterales bacterium]MDD4391170.1 LptA/OstA family protein [Desulfobacterales bacterium]